MSVSSPQQGGPFAITKIKLILVVSLIFTWWFAHLLPRYQNTIRSQVSTVANSVSSRLQDARQQIPAIKVDWTVPAEPQADYDPSKVALIIETRPLPHLVPLILHMISVVPPDWRFVVIGSVESIYSINRAYAMKHQQVIGKLDLLVLPEPWSITNKEMVSRMLTDLRFYDEFLPGVEWILRYEADSILCANSPKSLNDWLEWAWAGAPRDENDRFSGTGGLSLRKVAAVRRVLNFQARFNDSESEDIWFGRRLWVMPGEKVTTGLTALAVEGFYVDKPMGFHIPKDGKEISDDVWKNAEQRKKIFDYCPEIALITDMKLERERCDGDDHEGTIVPVQHKEGGNS